jgi:VWFA-related protein
MLKRAQGRVAAAAAVLCVIYLNAQQPSTIRIPVRLVSVPTLVVCHDGKYIPGLSAKDFRVTDNDRPQTIQADVDVLPISLVVALQANQEVREYSEFIGRTGALLEDSIAGATGQSALITYNDGVTVAKPFEHGDFRDALRAVSLSGDKANAIDAGIRGIELLKERPSSFSRVLLFIGQPVDSAGGTKLETLEAEAERENVQIYALTLPILAKTFVSESFTLEGLGSQWYKGGYIASVKLTKAVPALRRAALAGTHADLFSLLTVDTGGIQLHFRRQKQLENAIIGLGDALRSRYFLSYRPDPYDIGFHRIAVSVDVPGATVYSRPGYRVTAE